MFKMAKNWSGMYDILFTSQANTLEHNSVGRQDCVFPLESETVGPKGRLWC